MALTDEEVVGTVRPGPSEAEMDSRSHGWQDLNDDLGQDQSTYHTTLEAQADMRNPRYKTDPYFREMVARKLHRSTPGDYGYEEMPPDKVTLGIDEQGKGTL